MPSFEKISRSFCSKLVLLILMHLMIVSCSSAPKKNMRKDSLSVQCFRVMGPDRRIFEIKVEVSKEKTENGSYELQGVTNSSWKNNPIAGTFRDKVDGYVWFLNQGTLLRLNSTSKRPYFKRLDAWLGEHYLVRSRFEHFSNLFKTLHCKEI